MMGSMTDSEKLKVLAAVIEKGGMPQGFENFPSEPAVELLRDVASRLDD